jgi:hypothetical protein
LDEIAYRVGTYGAFRQAMLRRVPIVDAAVAVELGLPAPPLLDWTARHGDDYGIALLELWATTADILTFYQERYANEAYLRTADRRESIRRLAGLLGYRLGTGRAAATYLAFTLAEDTTVELPAGLLTQSVPAEGEKPQKFETSAALSADAVLNRVPIFPQPVTVNALAAVSTGAAVQRRHGTLASTSHAPGIGDRIVAFAGGAGTIEQRTVEDTEEVDGRTVVTWSKPFRKTHTSAYSLGRTFRLFGHNAPASHLVSSVPTGTTTTVLQWTPTPTPFTLTAVSSLDLDGVVEGIEAGGSVLVVSPGAAPALRTISAVQQETATVGPQSGAVTRLTFSPAITGNRQTTTVHELGAPITFQSWEIPTTGIPALTTEVYAPYPEVAALEEGRVVVLADDADAPVLRTKLAADAVPYSPTSGGTHEFLRITLEDATAAVLDGDSAHLLANVVAATHGETIDDEVLGDGDATATFQTFKLKKSPLTHVASATARGGAASTLEVLVNRVRWKERDELYGAAGKDQSYEIEIDDEQSAIVRFGDGLTGARLPTGRQNVVATYRKGLGREGILDADQITTALDRPVGLKEVTNPVAATGGVDPETIDKARENAPNTVRTFDRAVSLRDFADLAREYSTVAKALATWVWDGEQRAVHLTVAGDDGVELDATERDELRTNLDLRRDPNRRLLLAPHVPVAIEVEAAVEVEASRITDDVAAAVTAAIADYFDFDNRGFGQAVHLSDVYAVIQEVDGVVWARVDALGYKDPAVAAAHSAGGAAVLAHLGINSARTGVRNGGVTGAELAVIANAATDLRVNATGGLAS